MDYHNRIIASSQLINGNVSASRPSPRLDRPFPKVANVDLANEVSQQRATEAIIESLKVSGACILRNMVSKNALDEIEKDIRPHLNTAKVWKGTVTLVLHTTAYVATLPRKHLPHTDVYPSFKATSTRWNREE